MSHTFARNHLHLIFATKHRLPSLKNDGREIAYGALRRTAIEYGVSVDTIGGTSDHVHLFLQLPPKVSAAAFVRAIKAHSSKAMNDRGHRFAWQEGYGLFSVSVSSVEAVRRYIEGQEEHHRRRTYDEEFAAMLRKHGFSLGDSPRAEPSSR